MTDHTTEPEPTTDHTTEPEPMTKHTTEREPTTEHHPEREPTTEHHPARDPGDSVPIRAVDAEAESDVTRDETSLPGDAEFVLLLTHDVDRPFKTYQAPYYALRDRDRTQLGSLFRGENPYWTFPTIRGIEDDLGVRSAFYFMDERSLTDLPVTSWFSPTAWRLFLGRYSLTDRRIVDLIGDLESDGWEIGLQGSYHSYRDRDRLDREKRRLDAIVDGAVRGGRQHYLNLDDPATWHHQRSLGLKYDATPGSSETFGFTDTYGFRRPFDDDFVVFPLTVMESALPDPAESYERAWNELEGVLDEAAENDAVMSVLWHPRHFSARDFPGYGRLYRQLIGAALDRGAWVGAPGEYYETLDHPTQSAAPSWTPVDSSAVPTIRYE